MLKDYRLPAEEWAVQAADFLAGQLETVLAEKGHASLALGGGSTPWPVYRALAAMPLDWANIVILPSDERWLPDDHRENNGRQIAEVFGATGADIISLYHDAYDRAGEGVADIEQRLNDRRALPVDVAAIGLGPDGHTLSWFPDGDGLDLALDEDGAGPVLALQAADGGAAVATNDRITLTLPVMQKAKHIILLTAGAAKAGVLDQVLQPGSKFEFPIRALLHQDKVPVTLFHNLDG